jgi:hypothetical protein
MISHLGSVDQTSGMAEKSEALPTRLTELRVVRRAHGEPRRGEEMDLCLLIRWKLGVWGIGCVSFFWAKSFVL